MLQPGFDPWDPLSTAIWLTFIASNGEVRCVVHASATANPRKEVTQPLVIIIFFATITGLD